MDNFISYDAVQTLFAYPPSLNPHPNFLNIRALWNHFAEALKKIPCSQPAVNGWAGAVVSPEMCILINTNPFHQNIAPVTTTPAHTNEFNPEGVLVPYTCNEKSTINAIFTMVKNYFETWKNIYRACYDTLDEHINDSFKVAPPTTPPTTGWNSTMTIRDIFHQLTMTYGIPTPDALLQNNINFLAAYSQQDLPEILFKRCTPMSKRSRPLPKIRTRHSNS